MKKIVASLLTAAALSAPAAYAQKTGDTVTPEVLSKLEWIKGEAPKAWEPGKLYVLECWATWCGPCVANIPHVDALFDKYSDKGLRVIGVDVWEDGKDKVAAFVKAKGDGMSYPVAYTGKGGAFETEWLKPAGVNGIPHAFLVKDGKVLAGVHPAQLSDEIIEKLLGDEASAKAALDDINAKQQAQAAVGKAVQALSAAAKNNDADAMASAIADLKAADPTSIYIPLFESQVLMLRSDWAGIEKSIDDTSAEAKTHQVVVANIARSLPKQKDVPAATLTKVSGAFEAQVADKKGPADAVILSRLYWATGDKDKALTEAKKSVELASAHAASTPGLSPVPFEKFSSAVEGGNMPSDEDFMGWIQEAVKGRVTAVKPATPATPAVVPATPAVVPATPRQEAK